MDARLRTSLGWWGWCDENTATPRDPATAPKEEETQQEEELMSILDVARVCDSSLPLAPP